MAGASVHSTRPPSPATGTFRLPTTTFLSFCSRVLLACSAPGESASIRKQLKLFQRRGQEEQTGRSTEERRYERARASQVSTIEDGSP